MSSPCTDAIEIDAMTSMSRRMVEVVVEVELHLEGPSMAEEYSGKKCGTVWVCSLGVIIVVVLCVEDCGVHI